MLMNNYRSIVHGQRFTVVGLFFIFLVALSLSRSVAPASAAEPAFTEIKPRLQINIPGLAPFTSAFQSGGYVTLPYLPEYISAVYNYLVGIAGIFATIMIMYGGMKWIFAAGDSSKITAAKDTIVHAVIGLVLALGSYVILYAINPATVSFKSLELLAIERKGIEGEHGGGELRAGGGEAQQYRLQSCDGLAANGAEFKAFFTTYFKPAYADASGYSAAYILSNKNDPSSGNEADTTTNSAFFCAVAMECSCPQGRDETKRCYSGGKWARDGERHGWAPCKAFGSSVEYCEHAAGGSLVPGETVAGDKDCFSHFTGQCELVIDNERTVKITDTGSGIRGNRFDLWVGTNNNDVGIESGVHSVRIVPGTCRQMRPYRGGQP